RPVDALHAVGALLHDPAAAHGHVRVLLELEAGGLVIGIEEEVEAAHLVGAVVGAVLRAHTAVVDHVVQAFVAVGGGRHRADHLAGRVLALHAGHGLRVGLDRLRPLRLARVVAVDADPVHLATLGHLVLAHHRDVVLGNAGGDAGVAADAGV